MPPLDRTADFDFDLPPHLVAQTPAAHRDESRLMIVDRAAGTIAHRRFRDLAELVPPGDALVLNTTRVVRARLLGTREGSGAPAEVFLLKPLPSRGERVYEAMVQPGAKLKPGRVVRVSPELSVEVLDATERGTRVVRLVTELGADDAIERFGHVPLPPYIRHGDAPEDVERYQTVYARERGSVAAPTAGLHFTPALLARLEERGVRRVDLVLHVGAGTFKPVDVEELERHVMHEEHYEMSAQSADALNATRAAGGSVWAVGTTSCRTLESVAADDGTFRAASGETSIFIRPPYRFRGVDKLVTNFHLPRSTLLMLVSAFAGYELTMRAYREAIDAGYRFYSYGDAMVLV
ncbi:MAG TPA: tRNA preQ1(34) S-adenosylmethionine ribosyltransferase-isomerase QueA [Gemmatimonadaceae bacterium]|nr:tRNA preQ1(34) S-adenosylmethionine ribosyltransferase-isomerase QueA [Gemmatimonadaceae bacterium]